MKLKQLVLTASLSATALLAVNQQADATEGGGGAYQPGSQSFMAAMVPSQAGNYFITYNLYYHADTFKNSSPSFDGFKATNIATIERFIHVSDVHLLGGTWVSHAFLIGGHVDINNLGGKDQSRFGMGDLIVDPFAIAWQSGNFHTVAGIDYYLPTGTYHKNDLANMGRNYFTAEPLVAFTYLNSAGWEFSIKGMYDFNFKNHATDYTSGQELHADVGAAKHVGPWSFGVGGYAYQQVTKDKGAGATFGSFKGRAFALGPQLSYTTGNGITLTAQYENEFDVKNRPEGDKIFVDASMKI